jgi:hypothetical protein
MNQQLQKAIDPAAWRADEIGGKAGLSRQLTIEELDAFEAFLNATRDVPELEVKKASYSDPHLEALGSAMKDAVMNGRGAVILTGLDLYRFGEDGFRRIFWYLGRLVGEPAVQSERGDKLGFVRQEKDSSLQRRGYTSNMELGFHADYHEVLALASVQTAHQGGESGLAPSLTLHNMLLERRPDLLKVLYQGHRDGIYCTNYTMAFEGRPPVPDDLPYFCAQDGFVSLIFGNHCEHVWAEALNEPIPPALAEALETVKTYAQEPGVAAQFILEPGEMVFWHNWTLLHARTAFENAAGHQRVLMRLWLHAEPSRPVHPRIFARPYELDQLHARIKAERELQATT